MKEKTCRVCKRDIGSRCITLEDFTLCETCFDFLLSKYGSTRKITQMYKRHWRKK